MGSRGALAGDAQGMGSLAASLSGTDTALLCVIESSEEDPGTNPSIRNLMMKLLKYGDYAMLCLYKLVLFKCRYSEARSLVCPQEMNPGRLLQICLSKKSLLFYAIQAPVCHSATGNISA